jgi:hypothetical protein
MAEHLQSKLGGGIRGQINHCSSPAAIRGYFHIITGIAIASADLFYIPTARSIACRLHRSQTLLQSRSSLTASIRCGEPAGNFQKA